MQAVVYEEPYKVEVEEVEERQDPGSDRCGHPHHVMAAYEHFNDREAGWTKVELTPTG